MDKMNDSVRVKRWERTVEIGERIGGQSSARATNVRRNSRER